MTAGLRRLLPDPGPADPEQDYAVPPGTPWLRANMVESLDGAVTAADGRSAGISTDADRLLFRTMRRLADVVLVGAGTARTEGYRPAALPIALVTARLELDLTSPLLAGAAHRTIVITAQSAGRDRIAAAAEVADVVVCGDERVDLAAGVDALRERGLLHVLCEGGPTLLASVVAAGLLDELCLTISPLLVGGDVRRILDGPPPGAQVEMELAHLLEAEGSLFARYLVRRGCARLPPCASP